MSAGSLEEFQDRHARAIARLYTQGCAERWQLSEEEFAMVLHRSAAGRFAADASYDAEGIEQYLGSLYAEDLALAAACERGSQQAWVEFLGRFRPVLLGAALALAREEARAQEITDGLYADLYGLEERDGRRRSLFRYFHGRSSLGAWLRSVVARTFVDGYRASQRGQALRGRLSEAMDREAAVMPPPIDPDRGRYLESLRQSLSRALAELEPRQRLRLSYYYAQQLTLAEVGRLLGEHESTVSRKLSETRAVLRKEVERRLRSDHGLGEDDVLTCYETALECWPFELCAELAPARGDGSE
jgi:RNA polymerase sigma-70 factor